MRSIKIISNAISNRFIKRSRAANRFKWPLAIRAGLLVAVGSMASASAQDGDRLGDHPTWNKNIREYGGYWRYGNDNEPGVLIIVSWECIPADTSVDGEDPFADWDTDHDGDVDEDDISTKGWGPPIPD